MKYISFGAASVALFIFGYAFYLYSYGWVFGDYEEKFDSYCLVEKAGGALNKVYKITGKYPARDDWVGSIRMSLSESSCGKKLEVVNGQLLDSFDDPIC